MTKSKDADLALESLEPIRQSIRRLCVQDQFTWEQSWKSVLCDVTQARRGLLLRDVFQQTLELNNVVLTKTALEAVVEQFQQPNGAVHALKFLHWIDLSRPADHVDPELVFVRLPQPYRRIMKVLERDILDAAWESIRTSSAKYKTETSAALSARSARSSVLLSHPQDEIAALQDDFTVAKKRCCKSFREIAAPSSSCVSVIAVKTHWRWPFAVITWRQTLENDAVGLVLQLLQTTPNSSLATIAMETPTFGDGKELRLVQSSDLHGFGGTGETPETRLAIAVHLQELQRSSATEATPSTPADQVLVYGFTISSAQTSPAYQLVSLPLVDPAETVTALSLSLDASYLAVSTSKNETTVYALPSSPTQESADTPPPLSPSIVTRLASDAAPSASYFLQPPVVESPHPPASATVSPPYAIAIVARKTLSKFVLPSLQDSATSSPAPVVSLPHLTAITTSSIDSTSQFITIGLADGLVVVWDALEHRAHIMLSPPSALVGSPVDSAFMYGTQFVVALFLAPQQLHFYDITNRAAPSLLRVVTPPQPSNRIEAQAAEPVRFRSLSARTPWLDVPVAIVEFSNGYAMLHDVRNGEAMASVRVPKTSDLRLHNEAGSDSLVVLTPSPVLFGWRDLLTTAFPSLGTVLEEKRLDLSVANAKRVFLASVDVSNVPFPSGLTLSVGARPSLESVLLATAGLSRMPPPFHSSESLTESKSSSSLSSHTDSRTSLASPPGAAGQNVHQGPEPFPPLVEVATQPYKPDFAALFERSCEEDLASNSAAQAAKLHRRRNELLKILTAAW